jgi:hypothetical protein
MVCVALRLCQATKKIVKPKGKEATPLEVRIAQEIANVEVRLARVCFFARLRLAKSYPFAAVCKCCVRR